MTYILANKSSRYNSVFSPLRPREPSNGEGEEAQFLHEAYETVFLHIKSSRVYASTEIETIKRILKCGSGYATLSFITRKTGLRVEDFYELINKNGDIKKSLISLDGNEVYRLSSPFGVIKDAWKAFCHLNAMKY